MAKKQIVCPNCGAPLKSSRLLEVECPYCGSKFQNPLNKKNGDNRIIKTIIPFSKDEEYLKECLYSCIINDDDTPIDFFDKLKITSAEQYYLPMYLFSGAYEADWSCTVVYQRKNNQGNYYDEYQPANGVAKGDFHKLVLASYGLDLPREVRDYVDVLSFSSELATKTDGFTPSFLIDADGNDIPVVSLDLSPTEAWNKDSLRNSIHDNAEHAVFNQTRNWTTIDKSVSVNYNGEFKDLILVPVWYAKYTYKDQEYYFAMDGSGSNFDYSHPKSFKSQGRFLKLIGRFLLMVGLLVVIIYPLSKIAGAGPQIAVALLGGIILAVRFVFEAAKSSEDMTAIKQIGKAKFCKEVKPDGVSSNYLSYKRTNQILMWCLIAIIAGWCYHSYSVNQRNEQDKLMQEQRLLEQTQNNIKQITPDLFFNQSKDKIGHLRQDIRKDLRKFGFEEDNQQYSFGEEMFTFYATDGKPILTIVLNGSSGLGYSNSEDDIKSVVIRLRDERLAGSFISDFKKQLTDKGFDVSNIKSELNRTRPQNAFIRIGKKKHVESIMTADLYAGDYLAWDAVVFKNDNILGVSIECFSKDETKGAPTSFLK